MGFCDECYLEGKPKVSRNESSDKGNLMETFGNTLGLDQQTRGEGRAAGAGTIALLF